MLENQRNFGIGLVTGLLKAVGYAIALQVPEKNTARLDVYDLC